MQTSTLPSYWVAPPTSRTSPYKQADEGCRYKIFYTDACWVYLWGVTYYHCQAHPTQFFFISYFPMQTYPKLKHKLMPFTTIGLEECCTVSAVDRKYPKEVGLANEARKHQCMQVHDKINNRQHRWVIACVKLRSWIIYALHGWVYCFWNIDICSPPHWRATIAHLECCGYVKQKATGRGRTEPGWNNKWRQTHIYYYIIYLV